MNVQTWLKQAKTKISPLDAELILAHSLKAEDRSYLSAHENDTISPKTLKTANQLLTRRAKYEPLAYLLGYKEFYGRKFTVTRHTLIPRPESEAIIELALSLKPQKILDLGSGSGCLAITLAAELPQSQITASDKSSRALKIAQQNAQNLLHDPTKVHFLKSDLLKQIPEPRSYDLIVANLPYVDKNWDFLNQKTLKYEPASALYSKNHGLALIQKLLDAIKQQNLHPHLILESDSSQQPAIIAYAQAQGFKFLGANGLALLFKC